MEDGKDLHLTLLNYRDGPIAGLNYSLSQQLMSRRLKTRLPVTESLLSPSVVYSAKEDPKGLQYLYKQHYDRGTNELPELHQGDTVRLLCSRTWQPAFVTDVSAAPRSYLVTVPGGHTYRRNRSHLQRVREPPPDVQPSCLDSDSHVPDPPASCEQRLRDESTQSPRGDSTTDLPRETPCVRRSTRTRRMPAKLSDYDVKIK